MTRVYNYSFVYYFSPGSTGYSSRTGNCVFLRESDAQAEMDAAIEAMEKDTRYGDFRLCSARTFPIEVK